MKNIFGKMIGFIACCTLSLSVAACERTLSGNEQTAVLSFSETSMDNFFVGLAANDYQQLSRDFDDYMFKDLPATKFTSWKTTIDDKLGRCTTRTVERVTQADEFYVVTYRATCAKALAVTVGVAFHARVPHTISHISIVSEALSWSSE